MCWFDYILVMFYFSLKDPGGLTDYIAAEYIPDFLGGPYEVIKAMRLILSQASMNSNKKF